MQQLDPHDWHTICLSLQKKSCPKSLLHLYFIDRIFTIICVTGSTQHRSKYVSQSISCPSWYTDSFAISLGVSTRRLRQWRTGVVQLSLLCWEDDARLISHYDNDTPGHLWRCLISFRRTARPRRKICRAVGYRAANFSITRKKKSPSKILNNKGRQHTNFTKYWQRQHPRMLPQGYV